MVNCQYRKKVSEKIAIDFAGPFKTARSIKKYLTVSVDSKTGWPDATFLRAPTTCKVIEFLKRYTTDNGIPHRIRTDPGTAFTSEKFQNSCEEYLIKHITCPIQDHRGNGKVERLIRTVNERLTANKNIINEWTDYFQRIVDFAHAFPRFSVMNNKTRPCITEFFGHYFPSFGRPCRLPHCNDSIEKGQQGTI